MDSVRTHSGETARPQYPVTRVPSHKNVRFLSALPNSLRNHFIAFIGEYVGTFLFLFFAFTGTQVANTAAKNITTATPALSGTSDVSVVMFIALSFGFSLAVNAWVFFRISGGLFNPAVTLALLCIGAFDTLRALSVFLAQILGAITAAGIVAGLFPGDMAVATTLGQGTTVARGLFIELFATFQLTFCIIMLAAEKHKSTYLAPIGIGLSLFISELGAVPFTGGSLNPARSFGPSVVLGAFDGYHWIYWLGPVMGALLAVGLYRLVKVLEYETANPGQEFDDLEHELFRQRTFSLAGVDEAEKGFGGLGGGDGGPVSREDVKRPVVGAASAAAAAGMGMSFSDASFGQFGHGVVSPKASRATMRPATGRTAVERA
ncbi:aquaporin-like protein [Pseudovirgaria hyperparasitica]|uniref:Aquaporin-like protein n=1 Tax=Pseudovirgaria hyperparasitica TaxID=470096 RepID=A0A6A6WIC5_9PEZI|nr:aquaporin-like protein [Pseudovirgaria hyperparasitica]KAF2761407.1 aquaporin-like protein [Pseudovirgaria hyperparasitica]